MAASTKTAEQLTKDDIDVFDRRHEIILALCHGALANNSCWHGETIGVTIMKAANTIIEWTEQP